MAAVVRNRSYLVLALALAGFIVVAFARTYYLRYWFDVPPITKLMHLHSLVFTVWVALFVTQATLISKRAYQTHMRLGVAGVAVAVLVVVFGLWATVVSAVTTRPRPMGMTAEQFTLLPTMAIGMFAVLVAAAVYYREQSNIHRRLMMLAMIAVLGPPVARILLLMPDLRVHFLAVQTSIAAAFVIGCLVADWVRHRTVHPIYAFGGTLLVLSWPLRAWFVRTPAWESVGHWMASLN